MVKKSRFSAVLLIVAVQLHIFFVNTVLNKMIWEFVINLKY